MRNSKKAFFFFFLIMGEASVFAQDTALTIERCYALARDNYPLIRKQELITRGKEYTVQNVSRLFLPRLTMSGQASYQSETIDFSAALPNLPGNSFPELSKDQYRIQADIDQVIYDGGTAKFRKASANIQASIQQQYLELSLYKLRERVTETYFAILLIEEQSKQNELRSADLREALAKTEGAYDNGTAYKSNVDELKAELVGIRMTAIELGATNKSYRKMLALLTGRENPDSLRLVMPEQKFGEAVIRRAELKLYEWQQRALDIREKHLKSVYTPRISGFAQAAYGQPTLNFIEDRFGPWFMGGIRLKWALGSLYTLKNDRDLLTVERQMTDINEEVFLFDTRLTLAGQQEEINKYRDLIKQDDEAIVLRRSVKVAAEAQLENGVITAHDFIVQVNAENRARQMKILHSIQLLQAMYKYLNTSGN